MHVVNYPKDSHNIFIPLQSEISGIYVENESAGKFEIAGLSSGLGSYTPEKEEPEFYNNRINDGSELTIVEAVENTGSKWVKEANRDH